MYKTVITIDHPQFEAFLHDGAEQNNQTPSEFFTDIFLDVMAKYNEEKESLEKENTVINNVEDFIDQNQLSELNSALIRKHFADGFKDVENFKMQIKQS